MINVSVGLKKLSQKGFFFEVPLSATDAADFDVKLFAHAYF